MWLLLIISIIVGIAVLISLVLAIPVDAVFDLDVHGKPRLKIRMLWLFGLVSFDAGGIKGKPKDVKEPTKPKEKPARPKKKAGLTETWRQFEMVFEILRTKGLLNEVKRLIIRLFHSFDITQINGDFSIGLFDPADTGFLFGIIAAVTIPFGQPLTGNFRLHPSFDGPALEGNLHGIVRVQPIYLVAPVLLFIFSPPLLRVVWTVVVTQWRKRRSQRKVRYPLTA